MTILHTSDWHLGQNLRDQSRDGDHSFFLDWLFHFMEANPVDALLVSGDIYDVPNPSQESRSLYHRFLARLAGAKLCKSIIITGGNHDSPSQLEITKEILGELNINVIGAMPDDPQDAIITIYDENNQAMGIVAAIPYLRGRDILGLVDTQSQTEIRSALTASIEQHFESMFYRAQGVQKSINPQLPIIAMGHLYADKNLTASDSMREIQVGREGVIPIESLAKGYDYIALGHIHQASRVFSSNKIRYSGSPLTLSFGERDETKYIVLVEVLAHGKEPRVQEIVVPQYRRLYRIIGNEAEIIAELHAKALLNTEYPGQAWIEVVIPKTAWDHGLQDRLKKLASELGLILVSVRTEVGTHGLEDVLTQGPELQDLHIGEVFSLLMEQKQIPKDEQVILGEFFNQVLKKYETDGLDP